MERTAVPAFNGAAPTWSRAVAHVHELFPGTQIRDDAMERAIQSVRDQANAKNDPVLWAAAMILQAPRAAAAQEQMDEHPHGYHNRQARLFELIDFNDTYVSAVLSAPDDELTTYADEAKRAMDRFCKQVNVRCFSNDQYEAIVHGLSREIAVYRGAAKEGFTVAMTSRTQDAFGIDMIITDPMSGRAINVDCKTRSAFYYRLKELAHEGRITTEIVAKAEDDGYCHIVNNDGVQEVAIVLWRIDEETYGTIQNFSFVDTIPLREKLHEILLVYGKAVLNEA